MSDRSFRLYDSSIHVTAASNQRERIGGHLMTWNRPDWETFHRLLNALAAAGYSFGPDPRIEKNYRSLSKAHRLGRRATPAGDLFVRAEASPLGCQFEFFQEIVTENPNGGRYDFDKRQKMPYLVGKAFEAAVRTARAHLTARGFVETIKLDSPVADPLAYFNQTWDGDYERRRGKHRFERGADGWPTAKEIDRAWENPSQPPIEHGSVWYFRDRGGRLARGRCYGGINGMWMVIYGPGPRDHTHLSRRELFQCSPAAEPRRVVPKDRGISRLQRELQRAVTTENYERAIVLRDNLKRAA
jgi:hypothetical protein